MTFREELISMGACQPAIDWVGDRTEEQAWSECENPQWMLWLNEKRGRKYLNWEQLDSLSFQQKPSFLDSLICRAESRPKIIQKYPWVKYFNSPAQQCDQIRKIFNFGKEGK